ncbi:MAG: queuosine precursor transporter, partial [Lachnospiraceae bacterium]|nr:queuosine precursor transporter [Lachnospiraceae bacterium]
QLMLLFTPNENDFVNEGMKLVFSLVPRVTFASLVSFVICQNLDVYLYHYIWSRTGNNKSGLWIRNNGSTLTSQLLDTVLFTTLAFWGTYPLNVFLSILVTTYLFKAIVALADTPFIYLARKIVPMTENADNYGTSSSVNPIFH